MSGIEVVMKVMVLWQVVVLGSDESFLSDKQNENQKFKSIKIHGPKLL